MSTTNQIQRLDDRTAASVRGSAVIGSVARAVEELVRNSVEGGAKCCSVSLNANNEIVVADDGFGIEPEAMRRYIGTEYCSAGERRDSLAVGVGSAGRKGESLRSLASLCVEMKIETACSVEGRKRKLHEDDNDKRGIVRSEKLFKDGAVVSFHQSTGDGDASSAIIPERSGAPSKSAVGTTITLRGLFHRHAVRRKHLANGSNAMEFAQIRSILRVLALSYPTISFELKDGSSGKVDCSYRAPEFVQGTSILQPSLAVEARALILRLCEIHPEDFSQENALELVLEESRQGKGSSVLRAFGAICLSSADGEDGPVRNKELEVIAINGRLATHNDSLADGILGEIRRCRGESCSVYFFIHVTSESGELVVKDSVATVSVPHIDRLQTFLNAMIANALANSGQHMLMTKTTDWDLQNGVGPSSWLGGKRFVKSQQIGATASNDEKRTTTKQPLPWSQPMPPPSPFSSAFCDVGQQPQPTEAGTRLRAKPAGNEKDISLLSFEDAFLDDTPKDAATLNSATNDNTYNFEDGQDTDDATAGTWSRQRIRGLERTIAAITDEANAGDSGEKITLTKQMLQKVEVIAQVADKFIVIKTSGLLCAVDQHAADERVALEKLENALFNPEMSDSDVVRMTNKSIAVSDLLKATALNPPVRISLSQKDASTVKHHWSLLQKWKFRLEEAGDAILVHTLPTVCDRPSSINDFLSFVKELGHFTGAGVDIKPAFVKNILASNACRYAIMFGDSLTHQQCVELIASLSRCDFCFICAHGRPSVIPLMDMKKDSKPSLNASNTKESAETSLRFAPKRLLQRK